MRPDSMRLDAMRPDATRLDHYTINFHIYLFIDMKCIFFMMSVISIESKKN